MPKRHKSPIGEQTLAGANDDDDNEDRISNLPDSILCHILSKLPTKYALGTAILSSKWKHLFASIPNLTLDIDDSLLLHRHPHPHQQLETDQNPAIHRRNTNFVSFMYHLLTVTLRDVSCIRKFHLHCNQDYGNEHIDAWLSAVLMFKVSRISIFFDVINTGVSIPSLFRCTTLVQLLWSQHHVLNVPSSVCLPNLKRLFLDYVRFLDGESFERILAGCPVLEDLSLDTCEFEDIEVLSISSPSLKLLMVNNCYHESEYEVILNTPMLELLYYDDHVAELYPSNNLNALLKAHIDVGPSEKQLEEEEVEIISHYDENVAELVMACTNVDFLYLSKASVSAINCSHCQLPTFHNLTELKLGDLNIHGWELLPHLLESAPNLEILVVMGGISEHRGCYERFQSRLLNHAPKCFSLHFRSIYFEEFNGEEDEFDLVKYFLTTAEVLKKMEFSFRSSLPLERQFCIWMKLLSLKRFSTNCQIEFTYQVKLNIVEFCLMDD